MPDRTLRDKLVDAYDAASTLIVFNLLWFVVSLPLITLIPATGALFYATNQQAHDQFAGWRTFFEGFRRCFWQSWRWGLLNLAVIAVIGANLLYYSRGGENWMALARGIVIVIAAVWFLLQIHTFPLLLEQEQPRLRLALRNSGVILLKRPLHSVRVGVIIALIAALSTVIMPPAWLFVTASACAYSANLATLNAIRAQRGSPSSTEG